MPVYEFRPVTEADLTLLGRWLKEPHVAEWWDDDNSTREIEEAMRDGATEPFIVSCDGRPIGYQQCYDPHAEQSHPYADQPVGTRGIDQFIGEPDMLGRGHGSAFIRVFCDRLFAQGAPRIVTDPDPRNARAIRAYAKAGFEPLEERATMYGNALLMARDPA
jgi:aminoglycoside 6'-N-acetyltransferase